VAIAPAPMVGSGSGRRSKVHYFNSTPHFKETLIVLPTPQAAGGLQTPCNTATYSKDVASQTCCGGSGACWRRRHVESFAGFELEGFGSNR
jgi:hypothetical protein